MPNLIWVILIFAVQLSVVGWLLRSAYNRRLDRRWDAIATGKPGELFIEGAVPTVEELSGRYRVLMLPRWLFFWFLNVKVIGGENESHNIAFGFIKWGLFFRVLFAGGLRLDYRISRRPFDRITDDLRRISEGVYLGRFYFTIRGRRVFVFWFLMKAIDK